MRRFMPLGTDLMTAPDSSPLQNPNRDKALPADVAHPKAIRTFVKRAGRITSGQSKAMAQFGPQFILPFQNTMLDVDAVFASDPRAPGAGSPIVLEIGFGMGEATAKIAALLPQTRFIGCEVHEPGIGALLKRIGEDDLHNLRICPHDAVEVLEQMIAPNSLDGIHVFFPDPWHKARHHKRRLLQAPLVAALAERLKRGAYVHCATDWQPYAEQMLEVLGAQALLHNTASARHPELGGYAPKPHYRPLTKFENRGLRLGHGVWDLVFERI